MVESLLRLGEEVHEAHPELDDPAALRADPRFEVVRLPPLDEAGALAVARDWAAGAGVAVSPETLSETFDLAAHSSSGMAAPGSVLRLLRLAHDRALRARGTQEVTGDDVLAAVSASSGLPAEILDPRSRLDLAQTRRFFTERVLGQPEAVDCLVERIALVKANLTDPTRPLGVFLFVGATGTGKTEIAKALAEYLFGSADRLVRLDMSEYQTWESLERLLADTSVEGSGAQLIASVRAHPFSVVLLDEFEKAHRSASRAPTGPSTRRACSGPSTAPSGPSSSTGSTASWSSSRCRAT